MEVFEWTLALLVGAVGLTALARRINVPYPSLLALGGLGLALLPSAPQFELDPELTLALFVAPVLLDSAFDTSIRDLRRQWIPVTCLVLAAVGVTIVAVAFAARALVPDMPWSSAVALGAIVAPPDAAAASAILKQLRLPHRLLVILEGESLLNDASALLIYRIAVMAAAAGAAPLSHAIPLSTLAILGSLVAGYLFARVYLRLTVAVADVPSSVVLQFAGTFSIWMLAERLHLSAIVTVVVFAVTIARDAPRLIPARQRIPSYAVWDLAVFVLNVLAFILIGLQLRPIFEGLAGAERMEYLRVSLIVLIVVVVARFAWVYLYSAVARLKKRWLGPGRWPGNATPTVQSALVVSWCGMRGIVTLAAAYALPPAFAYRDLILLSAFCVVVGTLVVQGLTLRPLILSLGLTDDGPVDREVHMTCERMARIGLAVLDADHSPEAQVLRREFEAQLAGHTPFGQDAEQTPYDTLRARIVAAQRTELIKMRTSDEIGDDAFHQIEAVLDVAELHANGGS